MEAVWQLIRMTAIWPVLIGATTTQATWHIIWLVNNRRVGGVGKVACLVSGILAWAATNMMANVWNDNESSYWLAFTVGLAIVALVQVGSATTRLLWWEK